MKNWDGWMIRMNNVMEDGREKMEDERVGSNGIRKWECGVRNEKE